jgi:hypothetical protein
VKISEVLFGIAILIEVTSVVRRRGWRASWNLKTEFDRLGVLGLLLALAISAAVTLLFADLSIGIPGVSRSSRVDFVLYLGYGIFALASWIVLRSTRRELFVGVLVQSLWLCALAVVAQILARFFPPMAQPLSNLGFAMDRWGSSFDGVSLLRNGPFLEGQHLGFYAGGLLVLALFSKRYVSATIAAFCALYSMSTTAFLAVAVAVLVTILAKPTRALLIATGGAAAVLALLVAGVRPLRETFLFQLAKLNLFGLGDPTRTVSLGVRSAKTEIGWRMMWDHPLGVGPGRFGIHFHDYVDEYSVFSSYIRDGDGRAIAENVYVQVGSELGVLGFVSLLVLLTALLCVTWARNRATFALIVFVSVGIATQSSWTFLPIWVFLAAGASTALSVSQGLSSRDTVSSPRRAYRLGVEPA